MTEKCLGCDTLIPHHGFCNICEPTAVLLLRAYKLGGVADYPKREGAKTVVDRVTATIERLPEP